MNKKNIPDWLRVRLASGGMLSFPMGVGGPTEQERARQASAEQAAAASGLAGISDATPNTTLGSTNLNRLTSYFVGQDPRTATAAMIGLGQTPASYERAGFYDDLGTARQRAGDIYGQQQGLAAALAARSRGEGPSLAEMQLQRTLEENQKRAQGAIGGVRGMSPELQQRLLLNQQAAMQQQAAGQGSMLRATEQLEAQKALGALLGGMRGAEGEAYSTAGQLGLGQEKLGVSTQEAAEDRRLKQAMANQQADLDRQRIQAQMDKTADESSIQMEDVAKTASGIASGVGAAKSAGLFAEGGNVEMAEGGKMPKAQIMKAHEFARNMLQDKEFRKRYGERAKNVAYALGMKQVQKAEGGHLKKGDPDTYITKDGRETERGLWANVYMKKKREGKLAEGGEVDESHLAKMDNPKNDKIPAMLSEGEAVIPRSIMSSKYSPERAAIFLEHLDKNKSPKEAKKLALGGSVEKLKQMEERIKTLEAMLRKKS